MSIPKSPTSPTRPGSRDTGFPDGFCGIRNTRLPHPDADLSPNACITADDISITRLLNRQRRSFLSKHKRTTSHGFIPHQMLHSTTMYSDAAAATAENSDGDSPVVHKQKSYPSTTDVMAGTKESEEDDGGENIVELGRPSTSNAGDDGEAREPPQLRTSSDSNAAQRKGVLRKMRFGKN